MTTTATPTTATRRSVRALTRLLGVGLLVAASFAAAPAATAFVGHGHGSDTAVSWSDVPTGTASRLRGLAPVSRRVAWVSGSLGTVLRTTDGGRTWQDVSPGGDTGALEFRDVEAFDARRAVIMSAGEGGDSRVYTTRDGGQTWRLGFQNTEASAFYDCIGFWDARHGIALSDPVGGRFRVISTRDGGASWSVVDPSGMPDALPGEFAFAASGTCLVTAGRSDAWIASGGGATSRVFHSTDRGRTWSVTSTPVKSAAAGGIFSLAVRGTDDLVAVGGDFTAPTVGADASATSTDAGATWAPGGTLGGYRSGAAWLSQRQHGRAPGTDAVIAVGPTGTDLSRDAGRTWTAVDTGSLDSVECTRDGACWASGAAGRVAVLRTR